MERMYIWLIYMASSVISHWMKPVTDILMKKLRQKLIMVCIMAYFGIAVFAMFLTTQVQFWILAIFVGMFQGGIQALSRSYFAKIIPPNQSGEYFGLLDICGKGASFMGTTIVSLVSQLTGDINKGVGMIAFMFIIEILLFRCAVKATNADRSVGEMDE